MFFEYPKMLYRANGEAIESITVGSEEEETAKAVDGFTSDLASIADPETGKPLPVAEETAKAVDGFTSDLASIADPETGKPLPVAEETAKAPKGKKKPAPVAEEAPAIIEDQAE